MRHYPLILCSFVLAASPAYAQAASDWAGAKVDSLGNRMETLSDKGKSGKYCTANASLCLRKDDVRNDNDAAPITLSMGGAAGSIGIMPSQHEDSRASIWPYVVRLSSKSAAPGGALVGVLHSRSRGYSGGGASTSMLELFLVTTKHGAASAQNIGEFSMGGGAMIRACFNEKDAKHRLGMCHDVYDQAISLAFAQPVANMPAFTYRSVATSTPGTSRRNEDNLENGQLKRADLKPRTDKRCTFVRTIRYKADSQRYWFNAALPDCSEFTADWNPKD